MFIANYRYINIIVIFILTIIFLRNGRIRPAHDVYPRATIYLFPKLLFYIYFVHSQADEWFFP